MPARNGPEKAVTLPKELAAELDRLKEATEGVEAIFIKDLVALMRKSMPKTSFGQSYGAEIYEDMMNDAIAKAAAKSGTLGIGKTLYSQLSKLVVSQHEARVRLGQGKPSTDIKA